MDRCPLLVPKTPDGELVWQMISDDQQTARERIVRHHHDCGDNWDWKKLYRLGWRCVPVKLVEMPGRKK